MPLPNPSQLRFMASEHLPPEASDRCGKQSDSPLVDCPGPDDEAGGYGIMASCHTNPRASLGQLKCQQ